MNNHQLTNRRRTMAEEVASGMTPTEVARKHGAGTGTVYKAMQEFGVAKPTAADRRLEMASEVDGGATGPQVAKKYRVSTATVRRACHEFAVEYRPGRRKRRRKSTAIKDALRTIRSASRKHGARQVCIRLDLDDVTLEKLRVILAQITAQGNDDKKPK